jgi:predicted  nucleic acid-binding Zn-ribbon protein
VSQNSALPVLPVLKDQLRALEQIQELDLKLDSLRKGKGGLPASLRALDDQLAKISGSLVLKKTALGELEKGQRQSQGALELIRDRIARSSARLESVANNQEFQATNKEVDQLKKQLEGLEEEAKKVSAKIESAKAELGVVEGNQSKLQAERDAQATAMTGETGKMEAEIGVLEKDRAKLTPSVEKRLLGQYDRVRAGRAGLGIAPALNGRCMACNMIVPAQQYIEVQRASQQHDCPSCKRILFVPASSQGGKT